MRYQFSCLLVIDIDSVTGKLGSTIKIAHAAAGCNSSRRFSFNKCVLSKIKNEIKMCAEIV